ncbi:hypothetical protein AbraIFM66950_011545 [Aspergillus brasiliensis]|nr:hypothetical protein AbraIFM66950_011545 [Aspergillus brasiliensis]
MVKDKDTVIDEFNSLVNMTPNELRDWLKDTQSQSSGWKNASSSSGETIGHERHVPFPIPNSPSLHLPKNGRKIVSILEHNPSKDPSGYSDEDVSHMRKVVSYCKRHLAQEETAKQNTDSKSYKSLKNWGHDPLKA